MCDLGVWCILLHACVAQTPPFPIWQVCGLRLWHVHACMHACVAQTPFPIWQVCGLRLMSSAELTKTYHHLFPVPTFYEQTKPELSPDDPPADTDLTVEGAGRCFGCAGVLPLASEETLALDLCRGFVCLGFGDTPRVGGFQCPGCEHIFCAACDEFLRCVLHSCPGCEVPREEVPPWVPPPGFDEAAVVANPPTSLDHWLP